LTSASLIQVYEWQPFVHEFRIYTSSGLAVVPFKGNISSITVNYRSAAPSSLTAIWNNDSSVLSITGYHQGIFVQDNWAVRTAENTTSINNYQGFGAVPGINQFWAAQAFTADPRSTSTIAVTVGFSDGETISWDQTVQHDRNLYRNTICGWIARGLQERSGDSTRQPCPPALEFPQASTSQEVLAFAFSTSISTTIYEFNLATAATALGWDGTAPMDAVISIESGGAVYSNSTATPAMTISDLPAGSTVLLNNAGNIIGRGGNGGNGCDITFQGNAGTGGNVITAAAVAGGAGGTAISLNSNIVINNTGIIAGGGGGGGGGGAGFGTLYCNSSAYGPVYSHNTIGDGGGGGGGAGFGAGATLARTATDATATAGSAGTAGKALLRYYTGTIVSTDYNRSWTGGSGGAGGGLGTAGSAGGIGVNQGSPGCPYEGGAGVGGREPAAGGAAGRAINLNGNSVTYTNVGSIYGTVS